MKPSWQDYVDHTLISSGYVSKAAFVGLDKAQIWATSRGFQVTQGEAKSVIKAFTEPEAYTRSGFTLDCKKYTLVKAAPSYIIGKCPRGGCMVARTAKIIVIAVWEENVHGGSVVSLVTKLTDYLRHQNF